LNGVGVPTYRIDLGYDGSGFRGYAKQREQRTVQGELEAALAKVCGVDVDTEVAGRTDAGVHARHQVVSFVLVEPIDPGRVARSIRGLLAPEISVIRCVQVEDSFSARFSATQRRYRYHVLNRPHIDPLRRHATWHVAEPLDVQVMNECAAQFVGEHDFASFCRKATGRSTVRTVLRAEWVECAEDILQFEIAGLAFCHQMVRSIVAFSVEVGRGRVEPDMAGEVLAARDRNQARGAAPPNGLILWQVCYQEPASPGWHGTKA
jgi:tRNA pseudouridine38-40 synthase